MGPSKVTAALVGLVLLSASCVAGPGAQTEPPGVPTETPTASGVESQPPATGDCYTAQSGMRNRLTNSVAELSKMSDLVAVGSVVAVSETRWATADGREPIRSAGQVPSVKDVYRLVTFRLSRVGKTSSPAATVVAGRSEIFIRADGGQIGCKKFEIDDEPNFEVGQEVAVFLFIQTTNARGASLPGDFAVMWPWWIDHGKVLVPLSLSRLSIDEFIAQSLSA
jgi:hypothetical protein